MKIKLENLELLIKCTWASWICIWRKWLVSRKASYKKKTSQSTKVEAVKSHHYSWENDLLTTAAQPPCQPQMSCQPLQPPPPSQPKLMVIPWGGQTTLLGTSVSLTNTCPIDNSLMILHSLTNESVKIRSYLENNNELVAQTLSKCLKLVENRKYAEAKLEC